MRAFELGESFRTVYFHSYTRSELIKYEQNNFKQSQNKVDTTYYEAKRADL